MGDLSTSFSFGVWTGHPDRQLRISQETWTPCFSFFLCFFFLLVNPKHAFSLAAYSALRGMPDPWVGSILVCLALSVTSF